MRNIEMISERALEMHAYVVHGQYVLENENLSKREKKEISLLLNQISSEIELLRWVLNLQDTTWFDQIDKPACMQS